MVTDRLTIDELARRTGMTVRNIRAHQSRGLLPPPEIDGRTGYYSDDHVARLELIAEMQADGFNLAAIKRLLDNSAGADSEVLGFKRALLGWEEEEPEFVTIDELTGRLKLQTEPPDPKLLDRAVKAGFLVDLGEGRYEVPSPTLFRAAEELRDLGVPSRTLVAVLEEIERSSRSIAQSFVRLFLDQVWRPFADRGQPDEEWPEVREALERMRPQAVDAVMAVFRRTMNEATEVRFGKELEAGPSRRARASRERRARSARARD
ncbi:MAG: MerR family transcriptional regulator [Thermoleophilaceae bacterium]